MDLITGRWLELAGLLINEEVTVGARSKAQGTYTEYQSALLFSEKYKIPIRDLGGNLVSDLKTRAAAQKKLFKKNGGDIPTLELMATQQFVALEKAWVMAKTDEKVGDGNLLYVKLAGDSNSKGTSQQEDLVIGFKDANENELSIFFSNKSGGSNITAATPGIGEVAKTLDFIDEKQAGNLSSKFLSAFEQTIRENYNPNLDVEDPAYIAYQQLKSAVEYFGETFDETVTSRQLAVLNQTKKIEQARKLPEAQKEFWSSVSSGISQLLKGAIQKWDYNVAKNIVFYTFERFYRMGTSIITKDAFPKYYFGNKGGKLVKMQLVHTPLIDACRKLLGEDSVEFGYAADDATGKSFQLTVDGVAFLSFNIDAGARSQGYRVAMKANVPKKIRKFPSVTLFSSQQSGQVDQQSGSTDIEFGLDEAADQLGAAAAQKLRDVVSKGDQFPPRVKDLLDAEKAKQRNAMTSFDLIKLLIQIYAAVKGLPAPNLTNVDKFRPYRPQIALAYRMTPDGPPWAAKKLKGKKPSSRVYKNIMSRKTVDTITITADTLEDLANKYLNQDNSPQTKLAKELYNQYKPSTNESKSYSLLERLFS